MTTSGTNEVPPEPGLTVLNPAAILHTVKNGTLAAIAAFRGTIMPGAAGPRPGVDQVGTRKMDPSRVYPVRTSQMGAPSSRQLQVVTGLPEYANFRQPLSGEIFVAEPTIYTRVVRRRMRAPLYTPALVPSRSASYRAPMWTTNPADVASQAPIIATFNARG